MTKHPVQAMRDVQHFGEQGGVVPVIDVASTSTFLKPADMERVFSGELAGCYLYSRHSNPTVDAFGKKLAALEGMEAALGVSSGMAAINCSIRQLMAGAARARAGEGSEAGVSGGHIIASKTIYGGTYALFKNVLPQSGIRITFVDTNDVKAIEAAVQKDTVLVYTETVSNPLLRVPDFRAIKSVCVKHNLKLVVDNTFTPVMVQPAKFGADVVVYSCTKYISGGSDMIAGAIVSSNDFIQSLIDINHGMVMLTGPNMDPRVAHELYLRLDHLPVRMQAHSKSAAYLAKHMAEQGLKPIYPGLESHPDYKVLSATMNPEFGFGGMVVLDCKTVEQAFALAQKLQDEMFGLYAVSLGFSRTLLSCPSVSTSSEIPIEEQTEMGLSRGLLRMSIGFVGDDKTMAERFMTCYRAVMK